MQTLGAIVLGMLSDHEDLVKHMVNYGDQSHDSSQLMIPRIEHFLIRRHLRKDGCALISYTKLHDPSLLVLGGKKNPISKICGQESKNICEQLKKS